MTRTFWLSFGDLQDGDRFRFVYNGTAAGPLLTKRRAGWYQDETGKRWRTGRKTAVQLEVQP